MVTIEGVLTTALGALESSHGGFIQDASGGIALYLDVPVVGMWPAGTTVTVEGTVSSRFSQRTLRISESALIPGPAADLPAAVPLETGAASESFEGQRVRLSGTIIGAPDQLTDGLGVTLDDGSGTIRAVVGPDAVGGQSLASGMVATISGPLGQRDSSGTGTAAIASTRPCPASSSWLPRQRRAPSRPDAESDAYPDPDADASPTGPEPIPQPPRRQRPLRPQPPRRPRPRRPDTFSVAHATTLDVNLDAVRTLPIGTRVDDTASSSPRTAGSERRSCSESATIQPASWSIPSGAGAYPRGTRLDVTGKLAAPYGQLEIRPAKSDIHVVGTAACRRRPQSHLPVSLSRSKATLSL